MQQIPIKIGFFGGAFDPFHLGHLGMTKAAWRQLNLDQIMLVPTYAPAHKSASFFCYEDRVQMLQLATAEYPWIHVSRLESQLPQPSYSYRSLLALHQSFKAQNTPLELTLIIGGDAFASFKSWYEWQNLQRLCKIAVFPRQNAQREQLLQQNYQLETEVIWLETPGWPYSSTAIRDALINNDTSNTTDPLDTTGDLDRMVPVAVSKWIKKNRNAFNK